MEVDYREFDPYKMTFRIEFLEEGPRFCPQYLYSNNKTSDLRVATLGANPSAIDIAGRRDVMDLIGRETANEHYIFEMLEWQKATK
jgi:hypothetical protein